MAALRAPGSLFGGRINGVPSAAQHPPTAPKSPKTTLKKNQHLPTNLKSSQITPKFNNPNVSKVPQKAAPPKHPKKPQKAPICPKPFSTAGVRAAEVVGAAGAALWGWGGFGVGGTPKNAIFIGDPEPK